MIQTLKSLFERLEKHYPEAVTKRLRDYCLDTESKYYTGRFSLKYIIYRLRDSYTEQIFSIFRSISENLIIYKKDCRTEKLHKLPCLTEYRKFIMAKPDFDINKFLKIKTKSGYIALVNDTPHNLTNRIFTEFKTLELIIFFNNENNSWGYIFKENNKLIEKQNRIEKLIKWLSDHSYDFQAFSKNSMINLIINHGIGINKMELSEMIMIAQTIL